MVHIICKIVLLSYIHHLNYKIRKQQHFGSWILHLSSGKKGGRRTESLIELASDLDQS
jgi:hypothetical protein